MSSHCYSKPQCLTIVFTGSELNPQRQTFCLRLLPSWGASIHHWWARRSFSQEDQEKTSPQSPYSPDGGETVTKSLREVAAKGSKEWMLRGGRALLRRRTKCPPRFCPWVQPGHTLCFWLWKIHQQISWSLFLSLWFIYFFLATMGWGRKEFPPCYYFT